jgi:hypothetical protein
VWSNSVVVLSPGFDHDLCLLQAVEDLSRNQQRDRTCGT